MRYYIIAGEASGDLHGSNLIRGILEQDPDAHIRCWGGDLMEEAGGTLVKHYRDLAFMGFVEVISNLGTIMQNLKTCKADVEKFNPDVLVLIDYPGFNLRIAKWANQKGIKVVYYISPQVWAWKESRVKTIRKHVDRMIVILPFEKNFYEKWNFQVDYVGHPLVEVVEEKLNSEDLSITEESPLSQKNIVALLPGSRKQEILTKLPIMLEAVKAFPGYNFILAKSSAIPDEFYAPLLEGHSNLRSVRNKTYSLLMRAKAALVTSGTATLETALFDVPQVVCYKGSSISYLIAKRLIKVNYISLVNLIMNKPVVKELIQHELTPENLIRELDRILHDKDAVAKMHEDYLKLKHLLKEDGKASAKAAAIVVKEASTVAGKASVSSQPGKMQEDSVEKL